MVQEALLKDLLMQASTVKTSRKAQFDIVLQCFVASLTAVSLGDCRVENADGSGSDSGGGADVATDAVAADQRDDGIVRDIPSAVRAGGDAGSGSGRGELS